MHTVRMKAECLAVGSGVLPIMATLSFPSLNQRLLRTFRAQAAAEPVPQWPRQSLQLCLNVLRDMRESVVEARQALEEELAAGVEARSFAHVYAPFLPIAEEHADIVRELVGTLAPAEDSASRSVAAELRQLQGENERFRDVLADALAHATAPPSPVNWERIRAAEEAYARGETKPFSRR
jgi:hypothetical protein